MNQKGARAISSDGIYESLAERIRSGDASAEERVVQLFDRRIRAFVMVHSKDPDLAEELAQEVLWATIRALREGRVQEPARLPAFVLGTARNLVNGTIRTRAREKHQQLPPDLDIPRPAVEQHEFERLRAAHQAIETLDRHERDVLLLSLVDGLHPEQIAARLGLTQDAVRQRRSRAVRKLAELLRPASHSGRAGLLEGMDR